MRTDAASPSSRRPTGVLRRLIWSRQFGLVLVTVGPAACLAAGALAGDWLLWSFLAFLFVVVGLRLRRRVADARPGVVYLRWRGTLDAVTPTDALPEPAVARVLADVGPLVPVGAGDDLVVPSGSARLYVLRHRWAEVADATLAAAGLVLVHAGRIAPGLGDELRRVRRHAQPSRTVLFVPPPGDPQWPAREVYDAFWVAAADALGVVPPADPARVRFYAFGPGWELIPLEPHGPPGRFARRLGTRARVRARQVRAELAPFFEARDYPPVPADDGTAPNPETAATPFAASDAGAEAAPPAQHPRGEARGGRDRPMIEEF